MLAIRLSCAAEVKWNGAREQAGMTRLWSTMRLETNGKNGACTAEDGQWAVKREGHKEGRLFSTQREAIKSARKIAKGESSGQLVVHGRNGQIRERDTYGMPPIQDPPGKKSAKIERAVEKITRDRLEADPSPPRA